LASLRFGMKDLPQSALRHPWSLVSEAILGVMNGLPTFGVTNDMLR
jgi:hypothetical protein